MNETLYRWTYFHKVVRQQNSGAVEGFILPHSAVYLRIQKWKNYWNRSTFAKVIIKIKVAPFFWPTVYFPILRHPSAAQYYRSEHLTNINLHYIGLVRQVMWSDEKGIQFTVSVRRTVHRSKQKASSNNKRHYLVNFITVFVPNLSHAPGTCKQKSRKSHLKPASQPCFLGCKPADLSRISSTLVEIIYGPHILSTNLLLSQPTRGFIHRMAGVLVTTITIIHLLNTPDGSSRHVHVHTSQYRIPVKTMDLTLVLQSCFFSFVSLSSACLSSSCSLAVVSVTCISCWQTSFSRFVSTSTGVDGWAEND